MKADLNISLTFCQILDLVRQLPSQQRIRLTKELKKEAIDSRLSQIFQSFKINELSQEPIDEEVDVVRKEHNERS
jgi:hypothetical protein